RLVQIFSTQGNSQQTPSAPFANFSSSGQNTTVSAVAFSGSGSGAADSDVDFYESSSTFDITFLATGPTQFDMSGTFVVNMGDFGGANVLVSLYTGDQLDSANEIYGDALVADEFGEFTSDFGFSAVLPAGTYRLLLETDATPSFIPAYAGFDFDVALLTDADNDGIDDALDNCVFTDNIDQRDSDLDGFGNACDADLTNDCIVNVADLGRLRQLFFTSIGSADFNNDGVVNTIDLGIMRTLFFAPPGPSAFASCSSVQ
ncbi:MAG: thrombospondin type 3 repeat-containing protein, partial [Gammaproteobacteria bacterium]